MSMVARHKKQTELYVIHFRRALDIGCAVGGATFELTRTFDEVMGIDFSHSFIAAANHMKTEKSREYQMVIEGSITEPKVADLPSGVNADRASFSQVRFAKSRTEDIIVGFRKRTKSLQGNFCLKAV